MEPEDNRKITINEECPTPPRTAAEDSTLINIEHSDSTHNNSQEKMKKQSEDILFTNQTIRASQNHDTEEGESSNSYNTNSAPEAPPKCCSNTIRDKGVNDQDINTQRASVSKEATLRRPTTNTGPSNGEETKFSNAGETLQCTTTSEESNSNVVATMDKESQKDTPVYSTESTQQNSYNGQHELTDLKSNSLNSAGSRYSDGNENSVEKSPNTDYQRSQT